MRNTLDGLVLAAAKTVQVKHMPLTTETRVEYLGLAIWLMGNNTVVVAGVSRPCSQPKGLWIVTNSNTEGY